MHLRPIFRLFCFPQNKITLVEISPLLESPISPYPPPGLPFRRSPLCKPAFNPQQPLTPPTGLPSRRSPLCEPAFNCRVGNPQQPITPRPACCPSGDRYASPSLLAAQVAQSYRFGHASQHVIIMYFHQKSKVEQDQHNARKFIFLYFSISVQSQDQKYVPNIVLFKNRENVHFDFNFFLSPNFLKTEIIMTPKIIFNSSCHSPNIRPL